MGFTVAFLSMQSILLPCPLPLFYVAKCLQYYGLTPVLAES